VFYCHLTIRPHTPPKFLKYLHQRLDTLESKTKVKLSIVDLLNPFTKADVESLGGILNSSRPNEARGAITNLEIKCMLQIYVFTIFNNISFLLNSE